MALGIVSGLVPGIFVRGGALYSLGWRLIFFWVVPSMVPSEGCAVNLSRVLDSNLSGRPLIGTASRAFLGTTHENAVGPV